MGERRIAEDVGGWKKRLLKFGEKHNVGKLWEVGRALC